MDDDEAIHEAQIREMLRELARIDEWWHCRDDHQDPGEES